MDLTGRIKVLMNTQEISASFKKRELVLTTQEQYPQDILVEFTQDRISLLDGFSVGDEVNIGINIRGREWTNPKDGNVRYFVSIHGWKIEKVGSAALTGDGVPMEQMPIPPADAEDDLPF